MLLGMQYAMIHAGYLSEFQVAMDAAQGEVETLSATSFDTLWSGAEFVNARAGGQRVSLPNFPQGALAIHIRPVPPAAINPTLLDLQVAACWESRGRRIGEDQNCNGVLDPGEDVNQNGWIDSPVMVSTRVGRET